MTGGHGGIDGSLHAFIDSVRARGDAVDAYDVAAG